MSAGPRTHFPKKRHTQFLVTKTGARGNNATPTVKKAGKKEFTATSKAYVNSTRLSDVDACGARVETRRRLVRMYSIRAVRRETSRKSPNTYLADEQGQQIGDRWTYGKSI